MCFKFWNRLGLSILGILFFTLNSCSPAQVYGNENLPELTSLEDNFKNPPPSARPRTWMHAMSGNMSREGLTKDLEAMADVGIGGIILFNVSHRIPDGKVQFNSPEHIEMTAHAAAECERLGLTFGVHNCDGWTSSGGPWVEPEHSMKQIVHREKVVNGGEIEMKLPEPSARGDYYEDVAVIAYPALTSEIADHNTKATITSSSPTFDTELAVDGRIDKRSRLDASKEGLSWIQFDYGKPHTVRSFYLNSEKQRTNGKVVIQSSDDGINFKNEQNLKVLRQGKREYAIDSHFEEITARYFRFATDMSFDISEINFSATYRFNDMLARTNLFKIENRRLPKIDPPSADMIIKKDDIIDLTKNVSSDGMLIAKLPAGQWTIMRVGYTITGAVNSPASDYGRGWEVDKMSRSSFRTFYEGYVRSVIEATKKVAPKALQYIEIDSYEVGGQNWTEGYEKYFKDHFGYDILEFLPLYAGKYIDDAETTDRILWDVRNFNSKLMTDNYFDYFTEMCHEDGLISYVEPYSFNAGFNELDASKKVDITMGEFWMHQRYQTESAVSGARIYGKNIISAESFSARSDVNWKGHPGSLKLTGDKAWTMGINEFMFHRYAHQANTKVVPGMTMSQFGSHIDRTQTWWDNAGKAWFKYLARGQYMLRQGIPVSSVLAFVGDGSPNSNVTRQSIKLPNHVNYNCVNTDALINRVTIDQGDLVFPDGLRYHVLSLSNTKEIKLSTLRRLAEFASEEVIIVGNKPIKLGGYNNSKEDFREFDKLIDLVWSKPNTYTEWDWDELFKKHSIPIDLLIDEGEGINYIHRRTDKEDIYFFFNANENSKTYQATFNVDGKIPEIWDPITGEITKLSSFHHINGQTKVTINLTGSGSTFIVFRESSKGIKTLVTNERESLANSKMMLTDENDILLEISENGEYNLTFSDGSSKTIIEKDMPSSIDLSKNWNVSFNDLKLGEQQFKFAKLLDWTSHDNDVVKYYSGTAVYSKDIEIDNGLISKDNKLILDLGDVSIAARVIVNGKDLGVIWAAPYKIDITEYLNKGANNIQIEVTNQWTNRLIGDMKYPDVSGYEITMDAMPEWYTNNEPAPLGERSTFTTYSFYKADDSLIPAGLVGPVRIKVVKSISL